MPDSPHDLTPVGDILVSYEAAQMPTLALSELIEDTLAQHGPGFMTDSDAAVILGWLARIAVQKLRALEAQC